MYDRIVTELTTTSIAFDKHEDVNELFCPPQTASHGKPNVEQDSESML